MVENITFECKNITCCSLELNWFYKSSTINSYKIYQKEGGDHYLTNLWYFEVIYEGKDIKLEIRNLKPNQEYTFKLEINTKESRETKKIVTKTLKAPPAIISDKSLEIANGEITEEKGRLGDYQKNIIQNCSKLIFGDNDDNVLLGVFDGISIKLTHEIENNIYYMSFDLESNHFYDFFNQYLKECNSNLIIPFHFVIPKLPTIFILDLLEKSSVIFTGRRMGGVIASSLAFYIMHIGKSMNINYGNTFLKEEKKSLGVVTFGSPSFLTNLYLAITMKDLSPYFYHIIEEFDFIPEIVDYISHGNNFDSSNKYLKDFNFKELINIFNNIELDVNEIKLLNTYLTAIGFTEYNLKLYIEKYLRIPFGYYFMMKSSDASLIKINEHTFIPFYYKKKFETKKSTSHLTIYKNLASEINFSKKILNYLLDKNKNIEIVKIIRRNNESESKPANSNIKVIIKFELLESSCDKITPDIIDKIKLYSSNKQEIIIRAKDIFYDNDTEITAYIEIPNESSNINAVTVINNFSGELKAKYILNIQGSGPTKKMLYDNLEKLFLIPFFKLFEIFYISKNDEEKYIELKKENFGSNFNDLKFLQSFGKQINAINNLLLFTRPDLLANREKEFIKMFIEDDLKKRELGKEDEENLIKCIKEHLINYYKNAIILQKEQNCNCIDSEKDSTAKENSFPIKIPEKEIKKLFMSKFNYSEIKEINSIFKEYKGSQFPNFSVEYFLNEILKAIEQQLKEKLANISENEIKNFLNKNIGKFYNLFILPKVHFIRMLILVSIEGGDSIKFYHSLNWENFLSKLKTNPLVLINLFPSAREGFFEKDFVKYFPKEKIEKIHMKNLFYKKKLKKLINSNLDSNNKDDFSENHSFDKNNNGDNYINKIKTFSKFTENGDTIGEKYYEAFLQLFNHSSNDFQEDIESSIYDNLKEEKDENYSKKYNLIAIIDMMNDNIIDEESKKGFLGLLKQSYLLGKLRTNIVSIIYLILYSQIIGKRIYYRYIR